MSSKDDWIGWALAGVAAGLTFTAMAKTHDRGTALIAWAVLLIIFIERRARKVLTAKTIRIVDSEGVLRGLIGYVGDGIQIGVRTEHLNNIAMSPAILWENQPSVSFNFRGYQAYAGGELCGNFGSFQKTECQEGMYKSYAATFDLVPKWSEVEAELEKESRKLNTGAAQSP